MKKLILYFLLITFQISFAQTGWFWQNPLPQGNNLNCVKFINNNTGWITGENGTIIKTTNGGINWDLQDSPVDYKLAFICFTDSLTGYATTNNSCLLTTTNGGLNWLGSFPFNSSSVGKIGFINSNTGFIAGSNSSIGGMIFKTTNKGINWSSFVPNPSYNVSSFQFVNQNTGWLVTGDRIFKTTDCGVSWSNRNYLYAGFYGVEFFMADTSSAVFWGNHYSTATIFKTTNSGNNYSLIRNFGSDTLFNSLIFVNTNTGYICGDKGVILKTTNFGDTWTSQLSNTGYNLKSICFFDPNNGWAVGQNGLILKTTNGGMNWVSKSNGIMAKFNSVRFQDGNLGWVSGPNILLKSTDIGNTWNQIPHDSIVGTMVKTYFLNNNTGWAISWESLYQNIYKTTNSGNNWIQQYHLFSGNMYTYYYFYDICFLNDQTGWVVGTQDICPAPNYNHSYTGAYVKTTNGGNSWSMTVSGYNATYNQIGFKGNTGWMMSNNSFLLKTTNLGNNWTTLPGPYASNVFNNSVSFVDENTGWITGYRPATYSTPNRAYISKTTNGGINWVTKDSLDNTIFNSIYFSNINVGWVAGYNATYNDGPIKGLIYATSNGGINWMNQKCPAKSNLNSVFFLNDMTGWIVGDSGTIIKTTSGVISGINSSTTVLPKNYFLNQNYPNPFNATTKINFEIPKSAKVKVTVYDILGRKIEELINSYFQAGQHTISWNAYNYSSGVYFYRIETDDFHQTKKCVLLK